jgi:CTP:molybdopterin cytidylyltransferase MocA
VTRSPSTPRKPALVLLAGGASARLGAVKALVPLQGKNALELLSAAGCDFDDEPPLVIAGMHHAEIRAALPKGLALAWNERWAEGRLTSVAAAVRALPGRDLCLAPVDVPRVPREVFGKLLRAWIEHGAPPRGWLAPFVAGVGEQGPRFGHPLIVGRALLSELGRFEPKEPLRRLRALAEPLLAVAVESERILEDLDTPDDWSRLAAPS